ncbi:MAG: NADH-quinone oxidoreductase subunit A [Candidatus Micrarchaeaceae archaeon]|jgi:NADH:ubiquinone oxidoreductase subunit 3 (subunit A)|nr:NAD(P)H-quinone oxidoreductase subunit 3 [Candidatus Micrarchaeota archaeon]HII09579.1 NAD(P)H-quinone oxidoreductase subunit 3 [Candidatus Micrarchaeota archaeon]
MLYDYVALLLFAAFAIFIPASFILASKLLRKRGRGNPVRNAPYESGEETIGRSRDIENEYLPYFMLFLPFEIVIAILIIWSSNVRQLDYGTNIAFIILGIFATAMSLIGYKIAKND